MRLQLHALAYNLANFLRTLALPEEVEPRTPERRMVGLQEPASGESL
jgi:hypothetical protein